MKKNINKKNKAIALSLAGMGLMLSLGACSNVGANAATLSANVSNQGTKGSTTNISVDNNTVSINGDGASSEGNVITISKAGNYNFTGTLDEGQIIVDADGDVNIQQFQYFIFQGCSDSCKERKLKYRIGGRY